ncbi:MAG: hypothetical protein ABJA71_12310, partial [Ginsengibacter sp.]
ILKKLNLTNATIIGLKDFENENLLAVKEKRTSAEYCWTCTPSIIDYTIKKYKVASCTYVDADLYFYDSPSVLINEMPSTYSVLITPHRYTPQHDISETAGFYCVQFLTFKNNADSLKVLEWWRDACIEWCYNRVEDGKFGDQKYLDDWPQRFRGVVWELKNLGGGVAPWNVQQYEFRNQNEKIKGIEKATNRKFNLIFFHFHACSFKKEISPFSKKVMLDYYSGYQLPKSSVKYIYKPYAKLLKKKSLFLAGLYALPVKVSGETKYNAYGFLKHNLKKIF